jgi:Beta-lactamase
MAMIAAVDEPGLETTVAEVLNRWPVAGLAVGVVRDGSLAWFHGHGVADIESGTPVGRDTVFRIASITKTITAIAVMQLQEQGLVDLDAPRPAPPTPTRTWPSRTWPRWSSASGCAWTTPMSAPPPLAWSAARPPTTPPITRPLLEACVATCKSCGDECARHAAHYEHCRVCEQACRRCEQACRELLGVFK